MAPLRVEEDKTLHEPTVPSPNNYYSPLAQCLPPSLAFLLLPHHARDMPLYLLFSPQIWMAPSLPPGLCLMSHIFCCFSFQIFKYLQIFPYSSMVVLPLIFDTHIFVYPTPTVTEYVPRTVAGF